MCEEFTFDGWKQWICTILSWCSHGSSWKDDDHDEFCGGANSYKTTNGKVVFLTQAESYHHCGSAFAHYSQLEFECTIQFQEKVQRQEKGKRLYCPACSLSCMQIWYFWHCPAVLYPAKHFNYECINFSIHFSNWMVWLSLVFASFLAHASLQGDSAAFLATKTSQRDLQPA